MKPEDINNKTDLLMLLLSSISNLYLQNESEILVRELKDTLDTALIHPSYANEHSINYDNQRLEFLGDAILNAVMAQELLYIFPKKQEGELTALRSYLVDAKMCYKIAKKINLDKYIMVGNGLKDSVPNSVLADGLEAVIGAACLIYEQIATHGEIYESYTDRHACMRNLIQLLWMDEIPRTDVECEQMFNNYKGKLQEYCQKNKYVLQYFDTSEGLPPNHFQITATVCKPKLDGVPYFRKDAINASIYVTSSSGSNKQEAEMNAARSILEQIKEKRNEQTRN